VSSIDDLVPAGLMPLGLAAAGLFADAVGVHALPAIETAIDVPAALAEGALPGVRAVRRRGIAGSRTGAYRPFGTTRRPSSAECSPFERPDRANRANADAHVGISSARLPT
jgi:hypothetical protein